MRRYVTIVFSDLVQHSRAWNRLPRQSMLTVIGEYRYVSESLASQYGSRHREFKGDGHLFIYDDADAAVRFGAHLISAWADHAQSLPDLRRIGAIPIRVGCHYGECTSMPGGDTWIGRAANLAKRVEELADPDTVLVTETILELLDLPRYGFEQAGRWSLKGDHLEERCLYRIAHVDETMPVDEGEETAESWFLRGVGFIATHSENTEQEENCYRNALALRADFAEAHNNLAIVLRRASREQEALEHYREALRIRAEYPEAHYNCAILLEALHDLSAAAEHYREALRIRPDYVDAHHRYAHLLRRQGDLTGCELHYRRTVELRPGYAEAHNNLAILLEDRGDGGSARRHYESALRIRPDYPQAHYNLALLLEAQDDIVNAEKHYREALRLLPDYPEAHNNLAAMLHGKGETSAAEHHYIEGLRLRPNDPELHYNYALLLKAKGATEQAATHLQTARDLAHHQRDDATAD